MRQDPRFVIVVPCLCGFIWRFLLVLLMCSLCTLCGLSRTPCSRHSVSLQPPRTKAPDSAELFVPPSERLGVGITCCRYCRNPCTVSVTAMAIRPGGD
ncbi:Piso0_004868 [Millerozyma farinosa CBS 7064]|uniref:Piso0_004868 protein n=1 Tax=Pichia sorbitophila (strain ATCC MYA-4447 / BCRC 22081 / CBS 7064 / NBRC 10061 / NRRL Y-12695) TaxID=559304 RepID=G8Y3L6_PICSO|nr:Piso0_004868 [Millerozyma farinosa CBS 7064]